MELQINVWNRKTLQSRKVPLITKNIFFLWFFFCMSFFLCNILSKRKRHCASDTDSFHLLQRWLFIKGSISMFSSSPLHIHFPLLFPCTCTFWFSFAFCFPFCAYKGRQGTQPWADGFTCGGNNLHCSRTQPTWEIWGAQGRKPELGQQSPG